MKYGFIGCGNMGGAIARAMSSKTKDIAVSDRSGKAKTLAAELGISYWDVEKIAQECGRIFLAVKPHMMAEVLKPLQKILKQKKPLLITMAAGLEIQKIEEFAGGDLPVIRIMPNTAVEDGDEDANYFQHVPYLDDFNTTRGTHLVSVTGVHIEPMGIYAGKSASLDELPDGATVAGPNDATNEGRALLTVVHLPSSSTYRSSPRMPAAVIWFMLKRSIEVQSAPIADASERNRTASPAASFPRSHTSLRTFDSRVSGRRE